MSSSSAAAGLLARQLKQMQNDKSISGISCGLVDSNVFEWEVMLMIDDDTKFYGGTESANQHHAHPLLAELTQPEKLQEDFSAPASHSPRSTPSFRQKCASRRQSSIPTVRQPLPLVARSPPLAYTNPSPTVYQNGEVCISILHPPEEDKYGYESAAERWSPVQTPETILLSVISMLSSPNDESPANVEAARLWRNDTPEFKKRVRKCVRDSLEFE